MKASSVDMAGREPEPVSTETTVAVVGMVREGAARTVDTVVVLRYHAAEGFLARARGLIGRPPPLPGCALLLHGVRVVHGFGMRYPLDLVFLDHDGNLVDCAILRPWQVAGCRAARHVLEMRAGEIERLGLRRGLRLQLIAAASIFPAMMRTVVLAVAVFVGLPEQASSQAASPVGRVATRTAGFAPLELTQPLAARTLQRLENEAETRYRTLGPDGGRGDREAPGERDDANERKDAAAAQDEVELIRLYETLMELASDRAAQSWLRIGNIHHRSGAVGAAIDAYRRLLDAAPQVGPRAAEAAVAERKGLLNLAVLALEQARMAVSRLQVLGDSTSATESHARELGVLESRLMQQHAASQDPPALAASRELAGHRSDPASLIQTPQIVERYTASARRNAVKAARGSLQVTPADGLPAGAVPKARPRSTSATLPNVEYLLGDPNRSKPAANGASGANGANGENGTGARRRGGSSSKPAAESR